jgi:hypothetical protein
MTVPMPYVPSNVYLLADNLDAALAAGEDIMTAALTWETGAGRDGDMIAVTRAAQRAAIENVRSLEQILIARVLKSRERSEEIAKRDPRFATVARLYNGGTAILIESVGDFGHPSAVNFESGGGLVAYLRDRGLIADDAAGPAEGQTFKFRDDFLIAGRIRLGTLLDLVAMYLDTLEIHYDLFGDAIVEPDLLPGETEPDDLSVEAQVAVPVLAATTARTEGPSVCDDDGEAEVDLEDVDSLRDALIEVRNMVALDQR